MKIKIRITRGLSIRDASGRFACPNEYCWREYFTMMHPPIVENYIPPGNEGYKAIISNCPNCGLELDWSWIIDDIYWANKSKHET